MFAPSLILALTAVLVFSSVWTAPSRAVAAPAGTEYPSSWTVAGQTATGVTPSGVVVTATLTGPGTLSLSNSLVLTGPAASYFPATGTNQVLRVDIENCTAVCGSITYTFSSPVRVPVLHVGDTGAAMAGSINGVVTTVAYHDHPISLSAGSFAVDSPGSESSKMAITNGGATIGIQNPATQSAGSDLTFPSCDAFGCGSYGITTSTSTVTSLAMDFGYGGTGTSQDAITLMLGFVPAPATVRIAKTSIDSTGTFSFSGMTNLSNTSDSLTTTVPGTPSASGQVNTVMNFQTAVSITEEPVPGFSFAGVSCLDSNAAITGNSTIDPAVSGTTVTIPGVNLVPDAAITCTFTNAANAPALSVVKSADKASLVKAGDVVGYSFLVTNTGNATVSDVAVGDVQAAPAGALAGPIACPVTVLAPQAQTICTGSYTVTQADIDHGSVADTATASGTGPGGAPVQSSPSSLSIPVTQAPALSVTKTAMLTDSNGDGLPDEGDTVRWQIAVKNAGNTTLTHVVLSDPTAGAPVCPKIALAPGEGMDCTVPTHTVSVTEASAGKVSNTATVSGEDPAGKVVSDTATADVVVRLAPVQSLGASLAYTGTVIGALVPWAAGAGAAGLILLLLVKRRRRITPGQE
ncbi:hypothetical protein AB4068_15475 [Arthrobacter sp. 2RAF22]|uniref:DUF7507 domain-containing protein n=1 Tax=Arthrobacter sp. 2RAF22 TaxID=3232996 RepID=UPI003F93ED63